MDVPGEVLALLRSQNKCLERFATMTRAFIQDAEARPQTVGDATLSRLELDRDSILKAYQLFDERITDQLTALQSSHGTSALRSQLGRQAPAISFEIDRKQSLLREIQAVDAQLMGLLEQAQAQAARDIQAARQANERLGRFKSSWVPDNGEELDQKA